MKTFTRPELAVLTDAVLQARACCGAHMFGDPEGACAACEKAEKTLKAAFELLGLERMYRCDFCHQSTPKLWWGPGWQTCPLCQRPGGGRSVDFSGGWPSDMKGKNDAQHHDDTKRADQAD